MNDHNPESQSQLPVARIQQNPQSDGIMPGGKHILASDRKKQERKRRGALTDDVLYSQARATLRSRVVGLDTVQEIMLSMAVGQRVSLGQPCNHLPGFRSNLLLVGGPGTGKSHVFQSICRAAGLPFAVVDACGFAPPGSKTGRPLEEVFGHLLHAAQGHVQHAEHSALLIEGIDEVDDPRLRQGWARLIGGQQRRVATPAGVALMDSSRVWFVAAGEFEGAANKSARRQSDRSLGFHTKTSGLFSTMPLLATDLVEWLGRPLASRFACSICMPKVDKDTLVSACALPESAWAQWVTTFRRDGLVLELTPEGREAAAEEALALGFGLRGLEFVFNATLAPWLSRIHNLRGRIRKAVVSRETIKTGSLELFHGAPAFPPEDELIRNLETDSSDLPERIQRQFPFGTIPQRPSRRASGTSTARLARLDDLKGLLQPKTRRSAGGRTVAG
jgi:ATP-dependent protease Clp ATPase subunit